MQGYPHEAQTQGYYQSLQPQQHTVTVVNQPQSKPAIQGQPQNIRQWSTGMFDCCSDCRECLCCLCCKPCSMCILAAQMEECVLGPFCLGWTFETAMRTKLRAQFGIQGSVLSDVCVMFCCNLCATSQMSREIKNLGYHP